MTLKSQKIWGMTPSRLIKTHRRFEGVFCLHLQGSWRMY